MNIDTHWLQNLPLPLLLGLSLLLGALHALEPGHSKAMLAAFVVAMRGTVPQAVLLGLSAALSHSLLIWVLAGLALASGDRLIQADAEPWLQVGSGVVVVAIGASMAWRYLRAPATGHARGHHRERDHAHDHGHGAHDHDHEHHHHHHPHDDAGEAQDSHAQAHARALAAGFSGRPVTPWQITLFGLGSGLMPCPAALTVLLLCLQLRQPLLGFAVVTSFSLGLAVTMVGIGVAAAAAVQRAARLPRFARIASVAAIASPAIVMCLGVFIALRGYAAL